MKKFLTVILCAVLSVISLFSFSACNKNLVVDKNNIVSPYEQTIVVGYVNYSPLNYVYRGTFMGFNTELALMTFNALGYNVEFKLVEPSDSQALLPSAEDVYEALDNESIDCFWGGITDGILNDDSRADFSYRYLENSLCFVNNNYVSQTITDLSDLKNKRISYSVGSTGELFFNEYLLEKIEGVVAVPTKNGQENAIHNVKFIGQTADFAVVDKLLALFLINNGSDFSGCLINSATNSSLPSYQFEQKYYCRVLFKKSLDQQNQPKINELRDKVNLMLETFANTGVLEFLATKSKYAFSNQSLSLADFIITDFSILN